MKIQLISLFIGLSFTTTLFSQEITEENYLKADKEIWKTYDQNCAKIIELKKKNPEKKDSLNTILKQLYEIANTKNYSTAIKYASVPSGLKRLFMVRLDLSKDTLLSLFNSLPHDMQESDYGKSLLLHINSKQIEEGDKCYDFEAVDSEGRKIQFSTLKNENILLLYGGLDCMGKSGRDFLQKLYQETQREKFQIVVYCKCSNVAQLKELKTKYAVDYLFVSDFLNDHSLMKINYGAQATPTCFLINKKRTVVVKSIGLPEDRLTKMQEENKL
jgi:peroxiredoxin